MLHKPLDLRKICIYISCSVVIFFIQYLLVTFFASESPVNLASYSGVFIADLHTIILFYLIPLNVTLIVLLNVDYIMRSLSTVYTPKKAQISRVVFHFTSYYRALETSSIVLSLFCLSLLIAFTLLYPSFIHRFAMNLYLSSSLFRALIAQFKQINSIIVGSLIGPSAFSFWAAFQPLIKQLMSIDPVWKYLLCQNIAAWSVSLISFAYVKYCSRSTKKT